MRAGNCHPSRRPASLDPQQWTALWFTDDPAAALHCQHCPVQATCAIHALEVSSETVGLFGGIGSEHRRGLRRVYDPTHTYDPRCRCRFCSKLAALLAGTRERHARNGIGAACGNRSTYSRGCHCFHCTLAAARYARGRVRT